VTANGGSNILSYGLEVDYGVGFVPVAGDPVEQTLRTLIVTDNISSGQTYPVRYRAKNIFGWSDYSPSETVIASTVPSEPINIVTVNELLQTFITVQWDSVANTGGFGIEISSYTIKIMQKDGLYSTPAGCDGIDPLTVSSRSCKVEMDVLVKAPYHLIQGSEVIAKV
jgi:hypothetical protein